MRMYKSPVFPFLLPASPFSATLRIWLESTPAGICTLMLSCPFTLPSPLHTLHGFSGCKPSPSHSGHIPPLVKEPNMVRCILCTWPVPRHEKHSFTLDPGSAPTPWHLTHVTNLERGITSSLLCKVA